MKASALAVGSMILGAFALLARAQPSHRPRAARPKRDAARGFPTDDAVEQAFDDLDYRRAVEAYRFFYPTVSTEAIFEGGREVGIADGKALMLLSAAPHHVVLTANSDTPYSSGVLDLGAAGPIVIELPEGPYVGLVDDHHQRWIVDLGIPGVDGGAGGKYVILPPGFSGVPPAGYFVGRSPTFKALFALRAIPTSGTAAAIEALRRVKVYPLARAGDPSSILPYVDVTRLPIDATPLRWEKSIAFWEKLKSVLDAEPLPAEFRPMTALLASLGIEAQRPFEPTARMTDVLERAAHDALSAMRVEAFASRRPDRLVWPDRAWEWVGLVPESPDFEQPTYIDRDARDRWFYQAIVASPAVFRRKVGGGSVYFLAARDASGAYLDGGKAYKLAIPQPVPAKLFWSVTAYDAATRSQVRTAQKRAVLGSLHETWRPRSDGTVDFYFGPNPPPDAGAPWIQTEPGKGFFLYFRIYGPQAASLDGSWKLADLAPLH